MFGMRVQKKEQLKELLMVEIFDELHQEISWNREDDHTKLLLLLSNYFCKSLLVEKRRFYFEIQEIKAINPKIYSLLCQLEELKK